MEQSESFGVDQKFLLTFSVLCLAFTVPDESYGFWADLLIDGHV